MRKFVVAAGVVLLILGAASPATAAETFRVRIVKGDGFRPATLTVKVGDSVRWTNLTDKKHQIVQNGGAFTSPVLTPGTGWTFTFKAPGHYRYHDGLRPALKGVVNVQGAPPNVSISASSSVVTYGSEVTLSGTISTQKEGQNVVILGKPYPDTSFTELDTVTTIAGGDWTYTTMPSILTTYQARFKGTNSQSVTVSVRPKITFRYARGYLSTRVAAGTSFAGHFVYLQRHTRFGQWINVRTLKLGIHSSRVFRPPHRRGLSVYRIFLTSNQAGPGYVSSHSGTQRVRRH
jgi:plastocyanin